MSLRAWLGEISLPVYILVMLFSTSAWIDMYGVWTELPLMVSVLPEGWSLMSYLIILVQMAGVIPIVYSVFIRFHPKKLKEWPIIYVIITIGAVSCLMLVFFWDYTAHVAGSEHSVGLFTFVLTLAIVDCFSNVVYLPYMDVFKPQYLTAKYTGEGLGSLLTGTLGLIQGSTGNAICTNISLDHYNLTTDQNTTAWHVTATYNKPRFPVHVFFLMLTSIMVTSGIAFTCLHFMPFVKKHHVTKVAQADNRYELAEEKLIKKHGFQSLKKSQDTNNVAMTAKNDALRTWQYLLLLFLTAFMAFLQYGVVPAIQSFATLPYGNMVYAYAVRYVTIAIPIAYFLTLFMPHGHVIVVTIFTSLGAVCGGYQLVLAFLSPHPPLQHSTAGALLAVLSAVAMVVMFSFARVMLAFLIQKHRGRAALVMIGTCTLIGASTGAITAFLLVNVMHAFTSLPVCSDV